MGKFAGFLKRVKQAAGNAVNIGSKVFQTEYNTAIPIVRPIAVAAADMLAPGVGTAVNTLTKPLQQLQDNLVNKGLNWVINKTDSTSSSKVVRPMINQEVKNMLTNNISSNLPLQVLNENFGKLPTPAPQEVMTQPSSQVLMNAQQEYYPSRPIRERLIMARPNSE